MGRLGAQIGQNTPSTQARSALFVKFALQPLGVPAVESAPRNLKDTLFFVAHVPPHELDEGRHPYSDNGDGGKAASSGGRQLGG